MDVGGGPRRKAWATDWFQVWEKPSSQEVEWPHQTELLGKKGSGVLGVSTHLVEVVVYVYVWGGSGSVCVVYWEGVVMLWCCVCVGRSITVS